jgi:peptide/nickel transport system substrate-binding protein
MIRRCCRSTLDVGHVPLHQQVIPWAMRANVSAFHRADNRLDIRWVRVE